MELIDNARDVFVVLGIVAAADLGIRYVAFETLESVGIDMALFGFVYSVIEAFRPSAERGAQTRAWLGVGILALAVIVHRSLREDLKRQIRAAFTQIQEPDSGSAKSATPAQRKTLSEFKDVAEWAIQLTVWNDKPGKRARRRDFARALNSALRSKDLGLKPDELTIEPGHQILGALLLAALGVAGLVVPLVRF